MCGPSHDHRQDPQPQPAQPPPQPDQPIIAVPDTEYCCDGMITLTIDKLGNYQRNAYGTTDW